MLTSRTFVRFHRQTDSHCSLANRRCVRFRHRRLLIPAIVWVGICLVTWAHAQEKSVKPGINDPFRKPDVGEFVERFEREGREVFDRREAIVEACNVKKGMVVADIGAGTGLFSRLFAERVGQEGKVYAVDISKEFVEYIEKSARQQGLSNIRGVVCRDDDVMLPENSVDLAFICDTYHHFEFPQRTMASLYRAIKPDGQLVLIDFHRIEGVSSDWILNHVRAGKEVFVKEIQEAGFQVVEEKPDLLKESYFVRFRKAPAPSRTGK